MGKNTPERQKFIIDNLVVEKDLEEVEQEKQKSSGNVSNRLKKFLEVFELNEIQRLLTKKGITKKIESEYDLEDPEILKIVNEDNMLNDDIRVHNSKSLENEGNIKLNQSKIHLQKMIGLLGIN